MKNKFSTAALILGILSVLLMWVPIIGWALMAAAIVLGFKALKRLKTGEEEKKGFAIAGIVIGFVAFMGSLLLLPLFLAYFAVLDPGSLVPDTVVFLAPLISTGNFAMHASTNSVEVELENVASGPIMLTNTGIIDCDNVVFSGEYAGKPVIPLETEIPVGGKFIVTWDCAGSPESNEKQVLDIAFNYVNAHLGMERTHHGRIIGSFE